MTKPPACHYTYILRCSDGTLYTGWTNDLRRRIKAHNEGTGGKYTRSRLPAELVYYEEFEEKRQAMQRECAIKGLTREEKERLIRDGSQGHTVTRAKERVCSVLDTLGLVYDVVEHPPMFTQADAELHPVSIDAVIFKNLFLRNKDKSRYYLYSLPLTKRADLVALARALGETRLSFGDEDALREKLGAKPGAVSFLNVVGAQDTDVSILIDSAALGFEHVGVHPNDNTATVILKPKDIPTILDACGVSFQFIAPENADDPAAR